MLHLQILYPGYSRERDISACICRAMQKSVLAIYTSEGGRSGVTLHQELLLLMDGKRVSSVVLSKL